MIEYIGSEMESKLGPDSRSSCLEGCCASTLDRRARLVLQYMPVNEMVLWLLWIGVLKDHSW